MTREEMWKEFENQLIRETQTPVTMSFNDAEKLTKLGIEETVAKWKKRLEQTRWIPVSERLPSDCNEDWVLAQIQEDNGYLWIPCVAEYIKRKDDWFSDANDIGYLRNHDGAFKVIAWMPLPKPYKAESEDKELE